MKTKLLLIILIISVLSYPALAQIKIKTDGNDMKAIITEIASDNYNGRKTGSPEGVKTEEFFMSEFKKLGLLPAGENGTYFHSYDISDYEIKSAELKINNRDFLMGYDLDFNVMDNSTGGNVKGEIVFAGYGIHSPENKRSDLDSADLKGKIALIIRGCPGNNYEKWGPAAIDSVKVKNCYERGAVGVLFFEPVNYNIRQYNFRDNRIAAFEKVMNFPVFMVRDHVARYIFNGTKLSYNGMLRMIDEGSNSFNTGKNADLKAEVEDISLKARNIIAMLPGTDSKLKKEFIIIGGHMDHVGVNMKNEIRNGADDNASGVAVTLGIARAMANSRFKPKRSIIFACWSGEEMGLLGSRAWCEKPTIDLYKTVVYFNLDMVGLGDGKLNMPGTLYAPEVTAFLKENLDSGSLEKITWSPGGLGGSDHNSFLMKGIPAFAGMTSGEHPDYHQPADDADKIKPEILQFVGNFIGTSAAILANSKNSFISQNRFDENLSQLKGLRNLMPLTMSGFLSIVENSKARLAVVNFSETLKGNADENLISILKNFDEAANKALTGKKMTFKSNPFDAVYRNRRTNEASLFACFNFGSVEYNELYIKTLSKSGFRMGILDDSFAGLNEVTKQISFLNCVNEQNIGIMISAKNPEKLKIVMEKSNRPVILVSKINQQVNDDLIKQIHNKGHYLLVQIDEGLQPEEQAKMVKTIYERLGADYLIISCDLSDLKSVEIYKKVLTVFEKSIPARDFQKISDTNMNIFMGKTMQDYPVKLIWR